MRKNKKKRIMIISLIGILILMTVGYAAFQTNLEIKGTSKVTSNWDIRITNVEESSKGGEGESAKEPRWTDLTANVEANLYQKGDFVEYEVTVENRGTLDAKLENIEEKIIGENEAIKITFSGYTKGEKLYKNTSKKIKVKIEYNPEFNGVPEEGSNEINIDFDYTQNNDYSHGENGEIISPNRYLVTYDCITNGGKECSSYNEYLKEEDKVNLNNPAEKEGYIFVGWNTNSNATEGLTELPMPSEDTNLYAIYKKELKVTYTKESTVSSISKQEETCNMYNNNQTCELTLPSITAKGYRILGWYNGSTKIGDSNSKYSITGNITLNAKAIDDIKPTTPTITNPSNGNWSSNDVTVKVTSIDEGSGIDHYEWYENNAWIKTSLTTTNGVGTITFTVNRNQTVKFRAVDKAGNISSEASTTIKIDKNNPTLSIATSKTTKAITVVATASAYSGISKYEFSNNGGSSWVNGGTNKTYTFSGLKNNTAYNIRARVTSGASRQTTTNNTSVTTNNIAVPTYKAVKTTTGKTVTVTFPSGCGSTYTCTYKKDSGSEVRVTSTSAAVAYTANGTLVGKVSDGTNTVSSSYTVTIDNGFYTSGSCKYYMQNGSRVKGWFCLFKGTSNQCTGNYDVFTTDDYYFDSSGCMKTGWLNIAYTSSSGKTCTSKYFYLESDGKLSKGWKQISGVWYYFALGTWTEAKWQSQDWLPYGCMMTGWVYSEEYSCASHGWYFNSNGSLATNTTINGSYVDGSGCWIQ